jgi:hypothetical protein
MLLGRKVINSLKLASKDSCRVFDQVAISMG